MPNLKNGSNRQIKKETIHTLLADEKKEPIKVKEQANIYSLLDKDKYKFLKKQKKKL